MDLQSYGMKIEGNKLVNNDGDTIAEDDMVTVSSRRQSIYRGQADFRRSSNRENSSKTALAST